MKKYLDYLWPLIGLVAVVWSVDLLWEKLKTEAGTDATVQALLEQGNLWDNIKIVAIRIGQKIAVIRPMPSCMPGSPPSSPMPRSPGTTASRCCISARRRASPGPISRCAPS
jgi:hypothetical protein